jgi:hypothetical protein
VWKFYLVEFYGEGFGELNRKGLVYKEGNLYLDKMSQKIIDETQPIVDAYYKEKGKEGKKVMILREKQIDPNIPTISLRAVEPLPEDDEVVISLKKHLASGVRVNKFKYDIPFTKENKKTDEIHEVWLTRTVIETKEYFPYCLSRIELKGEKQVTEHTPAQKSLFDMRVRITQMREALNTVCVDEKKLPKLQSLMTGALTPRMLLCVDR